MPQDDKGTGTVKPSSQPQTSGTVHAKPTDKWNSSIDAPTSTPTPVTEEKQTEQTISSKPATQPTAKKYGDWDTPEEILGTVQELRDKLNILEEENSLFRQHVPSFTQSPISETPKPAEQKAETEIVDDFDYDKFLVWDDKLRELALSPEKWHEGFNTWMKNALKGYSAVLRNQMKKEMESYASTFYDNKQKEFTVKQNVQRIYDNFFSNDKYKVFEIFKSVPLVLDAFDKECGQILGSASPAEKILYLGQGNVPGDLNLLLAKGAVNILKKLFPALSPAQAIEQLKFMSNPESTDKQMLQTQVKNPPVAPGARPVETKRQLPPAKSKMADMIKAVA